MIKKVFLFILVSTNLLFLQLSAKQAPVKPDSIRNKETVLDTLNIQSMVADTLVDHITPALLRLPDSLAKAKFAKEFKKGLGYPKIDFDALTKNFLLSSTSKTAYQNGLLLPKGETWIIVFVVILLLVVAVIKTNYLKQLILIIQSFFSNRSLLNLNKEDNFFISWPSLLLFIQFSFTLGLFTYLVFRYQELRTAIDIYFFLSVSVAIILLFLLKIVFLLIIGFLFEIQKPINEYIAILFLSYFNAGLLFSPFIVAYALSPLTYSQLYIKVVIVLLLIIFVSQFVRMVINILSNYQFSKFYLFLYFCALEICPMLILIKAIGLTANS